MNPKGAIGRRLLALLCGVAALATVASGVGRAADEGGRSDALDLVLGQPHWAQPQDFQEFACGTNGGPPSLRLASFADAQQCPPEPSGLHEVQFRYDDEGYYLALARRDAYLAGLLEHNRFGDFPIVASALFDSNGVLRGIRAVTDDRATDRVRRAARNMANVVRLLFGSDGWSCTDIPAAEGEEPVGDLLVKTDCRKETHDGRLILTESRYLQRSGQSIIDPANGQVRPSLFVSTSRFEIYQTGGVGQPVLSSAGELAGGPPEAAPPPPPGNREAMFLAGYAIDCPGCELSGADLKGRVLSGANLAGANLAGATLHRARLDRAVLDGADLTQANLNVANLTGASLVGADLSGALLYAANAAAADFSSAAMDGVMADEARFTAARLRNVRMNSASVVAASLAGSDLGGGSLVAATLATANLQRSTLAGADLTNANLFQARLRAALLTGANATGADFRQADLTDASADGADFTAARLVGALTGGLDLERAMLADTVMPDGNVER